MVGGERALEDGRRKHIGSEADVSGEITAQRVPVRFGSGARLKV